MIAFANLLAFVGLIASLLVLWRQSRPARVRLFVMQSALLAALAVTIAMYSRHWGLLVVAAAFIVLKVCVIPRALKRIAVGVPARPVTPGRSVGLSLLAGAVLVVVSYVIMLPVMIATDLPTSGAIPLAFAAALTGLFVCVTGRDAFAQILGFLVFENGIFGLALLGAYGLPILVEAGVFLDVLVVVLLMEGVVVHLRREHASIDVEHLRELRG